MQLKIFISRPILATVISLIILLCGLVAMFNMPVAQYPDISPPSISVSASYPGASAETIERTVAAQLEAKLNGVANVLYMSSNSTGNGSVSIRLTFEIGTDLNYAVNEVLNRVHSAIALLPPIVQALGVNVYKSSPDMLVVIDFFNNGHGKFNKYYMSNYLSRTLYNDLNLVHGVGQISFYGHTYAMRVWLNLNAMNALNITATDIATAIKEQSNEYVVGISNGMPTKDAILAFNITGSSMYATPKQFEDIILRVTQTQIIRLKDVARVELGASSYAVSAHTTFMKQNKLNAFEVAAMQIYMDPSANQLQVKQLVIDKLKQVSKNFPPGLDYKIAFDATQFVDASINNVKDALIDAFLLVGIVILIFLQDIRASIIALITVPVSVIGSFALLYLFGFSINTLSLFAMILAIGIVVDDAIVVVENIERLKITRSDIQLKEVIALAMDEVFGAVIAISLVLSVVFLPVMTLGGLSGVLYRQFAATISCTVLISALTALTLTPAVSFLLLKHKPTYGLFHKKFNAIFNKITEFYLKIAAKFIDWGKYMLIVLVLTISLAAIIFKIIPLSFVPNEDQGYFMASVYLPTSSSLNQTQEITQKISNEIIKKHAIAQIMQIVGVDFFGGGQNSYAATLIILLKNWKQRKALHNDVDSLVAFVNGLGQKYKNVTIRAFNTPPVRGLSTTGGIEFYLEDRVHGNLKKLDQKAKELEQLFMKHKEIRFAYHLLDTNVEQILVEADAAKTKFYKVNIQDVYNTIHYIYSNYNVNFAYIMQGLVWVILQGDYRYRKDMRDISNLYVQNKNRQLVAVQSLVKSKFYKDPQMVERFNNYPATKVIVMPNYGVSSGDVMNIIANEMQLHAKSYDYDWFGTSFMQTRSQKTSTIAFIFSLAMIYLVLCALYEMWRLPLVVLMGIPFALIGSGVMLFFRHQPNDLYFQISLITLLGLSAKNIILLIEFAHKHFMAGNSARDSALYALKIRFRPIVMTSITFIVGALPLVFAKGAGANAEHSVGTGIIGGMLGSVILGTLLVPCYFVLIMGNKNNKQKDK